MLLKPFDTFLENIHTVISGRFTAEVYFMGPSSKFEAYVSAAAASIHFNHNPRWSDHIYDDLMLKEPYILSLFSIFTIPIDEIYVPSYT